MYLTRDFLVRFDTTLSSKKTLFNFYNSLESNNVIKLVLKHKNAPAS